MSTAHWAERVRNDIFVTEEGEGEEEDEEVEEEGEEEEEEGSHPWRQYSQEEGEDQVTRTASTHLDYCNTL